MAWAGNAHRTIYERKQVILRLYLSNFTSEHTAELGLGQGIRMLGWLGTKVSFVESKSQMKKMMDCFASFEQMASMPDDINPGTWIVRHTNTAAVAGG